jgi:hypothetical protein
MELVVRFLKLIMFSKFIPVNTCRSHHLISMYYPSKCAPVNTTDYFSHLEYLYSYRQIHTAITCYVIMHNLIHIMDIYHTMVWMTPTLTKHPCCFLITFSFLQCFSKHFMPISLYNSLISIGQGNLTSITRIVCKNVEAIYTHQLCHMWSFPTRRE